MHSSRSYEISHSFRSFTELPEHLFFIKIF